MAVARLSRPPSRRVTVRRSQARLAETGKAVRHPRGVSNARRMRRGVEKGPGCCPYGDCFQAKVGTAKARRALNDPAAGQRRTVDALHPGGADDNLAWCERCPAPRAPVRAIMDARADHLPVVASVGQGHRPLAQQERQQQEFSTKLAIRAEPHAAWMLKRNIHAAAGR